MHSFIEFLIPDILAFLLPTQLTGNRISCRTIQR